MFEVVQWIIAALVPPVDADPAHQYRWRLTVAALMIVTPLSLAAHIWLACGYARPWFSGFAQQSALDDVDVTLETILAKQTEQHILTFREKQCAAMKSTDPDAPIVKGYALEGLQNSLNDWRNEHAGHDYRLPSCDEMGAL